MDHSLSLDPKFKWNCKTNHSCAFIFVQEVPRINFTKFGMVTIATLPNVQKPSIWHIPFPFQNTFQNVSKTKTRVMVSFYIAQAFNPYLDYKIWECIIAQIVWNTICFAFYKSSKCNFVGSPYEDHNGTNCNSNNLSYSTFPKLMKLDRKSVV